MGAAWTYARAHRVVGAALCVVALTGFLWVSQERSIGVSGAPVRVRWLLMEAVAVMATVPLVPTFGIVERTAVRRAAPALVRARCSMGVSLLGFIVALATGQRHDVLLTWFLLLTAAGLVAAVVLPDQAWLVVLLLGGGTVLVDHMTASVPVSHALEPIGVARAAGLHLLCAVTYVLAHCLRPFVRTS